MVKDPHETKNIYDDPKHAKLVSSLKQWFAKLRKKVGDDGSHYPDCENIVQEFWDYSDADRKKAAAISSDYLKRRKAELTEGIHNPKTSGKP